MSGSRSRSRRSMVCSTCIGQYARKQWLRVEKVRRQSRSLRHPPPSPSPQSSFSCFSPVFRGVGESLAPERRPPIPVSAQFPGAVSRGSITRFGWVRISLLTGNLQGILMESGLLPGVPSGIRKCYQYLASKFPTQSNREFFRLHQGSFLQEQGSPRVDQGCRGSCANPYSLACASQSSGTGLRMIRSSVRSAGWRPSRMANWIAGARKASCARVRM